MYCRWRTNYQEKIGISLTGLTLQHLCACPKSDFQHHMSWSISRFNDLMREVIVRFVDIDEIVDHNFLFITLIKGDRAIMMCITYNMLTQQVPSERNKNLRKKLRFDTKLQKFVLVIAYQMIADSESLSIFFLNMVWILYICTSM